MSALILLVNADEAELRRVERMLADEHYIVATTSSFRAASKLLKSVVPDLLVADANLDAFSGTQFAALSKVDHPHLAVLITNRSADPALEADATRRGFAFIGGLEDPERLLRAVRQTLGEYRGVGATVRQWR